MSPTDALTVLLNRTDLDSGNDATGSGTDATANAGAVVDVPGGGRIGIMFFLGEADATIADGAETLDLIIEGSPDGGSTWDPLVTFRTITASELKGSLLEMDESAGDTTFRRAAIVHLQLPDDDQDGLVQIRCNITASDTNHWAPFVAVVDPGSLRDEWLNDALLK